MIFLAIVCFIGAAALVYFAFHPKTAFFLDEGWKFKDNVEPSDAYAGIQGVGRVIGAVVLVGVGVGAIGMYFSDKRAAGEKAAITASSDRCRTEVLPRFQKTVKWDDTVLSNPNEVRALGKELGVDVDIHQSVSTVNNFPYDDVKVSDPKRPDGRQTLFVLSGADRYRGGESSSSPPTCPS